jgi:hypothetical protein
MPTGHVALAKSIRSTGIPAGTVPVTRAINTTAPLAGGGDLSGDRTLSLAVTPANPGGAIALQAASPGSVQTGHENISGTLIAGALSGPLTGNVTGNLTGNVTGNVTGALTGPASALKTAGGQVDVSASSDPITGQVLVASDATHAHWDSVVGTGSVFNVATTLPITGGPITTTGTLGLAVTAANPGGAVALQAIGPVPSPQSGVIYVGSSIYAGGAVMVAPDPAGADGVPLASIEISRGSGLRLQDWPGSGSTNGNSIDFVWPGAAPASPAAPSPGAVPGKIVASVWDSTDGAYAEIGKISLSVNTVGAHAEGAVSVQLQNPTTGAMGSVLDANSDRTKVAGSFALAGVANLALANGANQNVNAGAFTIFRVSGPTGVFSIGGIVNANHVDAKVIYVFNSTAFQMTLNNADAGSSAANRILTLTGANVNCKSFMLVWSIFDSCWVLLQYN